MSTDISDLVALVYRADWTQLSLSATISRTFDPDVDERLSQRKAAEVRRVIGAWPRVGHPRPEHDDEDDDVTPRDVERRVLIAPGGRCRVESSSGYLTLSDGGQSWVVGPADDEDEGGDTAEVVAERQAEAIRPGSEFGGLLTPRWLIACYDLQITGETAAGGRPAIRVTGTPRAASGRRRGTYHLLDRVEVLVDAELGILLRSQQIFEGQTRESAELCDLVIGPAEAGMPEMFAPPPDVRVEDEEQPFDDFQPPAGVGWQVAGAAAGAAANALGFAIRHAPRKKTAWPTDDDEPSMPADAELTARDWEGGQPPDDGVVNVLYRTGLPLPALTAELHEWIDAQAWMQFGRAMMDKIPEPFAGLLGPDALWDALGERAEDGGGHRIARLAVQLPGRYRLDYLSGHWNKRYKSIACDGEHTTKLFDDRVATGPVRPLDASFAAMLDSAWLLNGWRLSVAGPTTVAGRSGVAIRAVAVGTADNGADNTFTGADVVVDTELGVLLRNTTYAGGRATTRTELRGVVPDAGSRAFRIVPEPGMRAATDSGSPLADLNLPRPAEAATAAATLAAAGAVAITGWLDKHRQRRDQH